MDGGEEFDRLIWPVVMVLKTIGCWPYKPTDPPLEIAFQKCLIPCLGVASVVMTLAVTADMVRNLSDVDEATEIGLVLMECVLCGVRILLFTIRKRDMSYVLQMMRDDWAKATEEERAYLRKEARRTFRIAIIFIVALTFSLLNYTVIGVVKFLSELPDEVVLPFRGYFYFNYTTTKLQMAFAMNLASGLVGGESIASATSFSLVAVMHAAAKFAIARRRFEGLSIFDKDFDRKLADFAGAIENVISILNLTHVMLTTFFLAIAGYQATSMMRDMARIEKHTIALTVALLDLFLFCYSGNRLIEESEDIQDSVYSSDWYESRSTTSLQIVMLRSRIPCSVTAAKFYDMDLPSYTKVLQTAYSCYTLLLALRSE